MRLNVSGNAETTGSAKFEGEELLTRPMKEMKDVWGRDIAMVFQDPMTSLNPVVKVGRQITEHLRHHLGFSKAEAKATGIELLRSVRIPEAEERDGPTTDPPIRGEALLVGHGLSDLAGHPLTRHCRQPRHRRRACVNNPRPPG